MKNNNFDLLRLLAALAVVGFHMAVLTDEPDLQFLTVLGTTQALNIFFVISGFLIFQSCEKSRNLATYAANRARRLLPAYMTVVCAATVLGSLITTAPIHDYFGLATLKYLVVNLLFLNFLQPTLPGVFATNPLMAVNGSLWTIKVEVLFYFCVPVLVWLFRRLGVNRIAVVGYLLSAVWFGGLTWLAMKTGRAAFLELAKQTPGQFMYFFVGGMLFYHHDWVLRRGLWIGAIGIVLLTASIAWQLWFINPVAIGLVTIFVALVVPHLGNAARFGDFSYGIYVLHFPLLQTLIHFQVFKWNLIGALVLFACLLIAGAAASWHFIERPFLNRKRVRRLVPGQESTSPGADGSSTAARSVDVPFSTG